VVLSSQLIVERHQQAISGTCATAHT